jgi:hypothetical protein
MTLLISPTPALNSHQGQPRNKIRIKIDFEKMIREMRDWKKIRVFFEQVFEEIWACWDLKASSNQWSNEILRKLGKSDHPAATGTPPKISSKNRGKSRKPWKFPFVHLFVFSWFLLGLRMWSRVGQSKTTRWTAFKKIIIFLCFPCFSFVGKLSSFFGPLSAKTWGKMPGVFDDPQIFVRVFWAAGWTPLAGTGEKS